MEGLLPLVYRAIKKRRTRRQYQCLSSGAAQSYYNIISVADIYPQMDQGHSYNYLQDHPVRKMVDNNHGENRCGIRRYNYVGNFSHGFSSSPLQRRTRLAGVSSTHPARPRSQRMFSCITGVY